MNSKPSARKQFLALIPARGGSKRLPGKNLKLFQEITLLQHAINHALGSKYISESGEIAVSSDSEEILKSAQESPGIKLIRRPDYLSTDASTSEACIAHALFQYSADTLPTYTILLQPTSPLRTAADIDTCIELLLRIDGAIISNDPSGRRNGAIYAFRSSAFLERLDIPTTAGYHMRYDRSIDIDTIKDLEALQKRY